MQKEELCIKDLLFYFPKNKTKTSTIDVRLQNNPSNSNAREIYQYLQKLTQFNMVKLEIHLDELETRCYLRAEFGKAHPDTWWRHALAQLIKIAKTNNENNVVLHVSHPMELTNGDSEKPSPTLNNATMELEIKEKLQSDKISLLFLLIETKLEKLSQGLQEFSEKADPSSEDYDNILTKVTIIMDRFNTLTRYKQYYKSVDIKSENLSKCKIEHTISMVEQIKNDLNFLRQQNINLIVYILGLYKNSAYQPNIINIIDHLNTIQHLFVLLKISHKREQEQRQKDLLSNGSPIFCHENIDEFHQDYEIHQSIQNN